MNPKRTTLKHSGVRIDLLERTIYFNFKKISQPFFEFPITVLNLNFQEGKK